MPPPPDEAAIRVDHLPSVERLDARAVDAVELVVLGGVVRRTYQSMVGILTEQATAQLRAHLCFMGTSGIRPDGSVMDSTGIEVPVKRAMMDIATRSWLLVDHAKFPGVGFLEINPVTRFTGLITDRQPTADQLTVPPDSSLEVLVP